MKCLMNAWNHAKPSLYGWLLKQTQNPHEAEDIMQEVFLKAMGNSERFCTLQDGKSWLFKMTRNQLVDQLRRKIHSVDIEEFVMPTDISPAMVQLQRCLPKVLIKLTEQERDVIEQCDLNGMTQKDYAENRLARIIRSNLQPKGDLKWPNDALTKNGESCSNTMNPASCHNDYSVNVTD